MPMLINIPSTQFTTGSMDRIEVLVKRNLHDHTTMHNEYLAEYENCKEKSKVSRGMEILKESDHQVTTLGDWDEQDNEFKLSDNEINSRVVLTSSYKNELKRVKKKQNLNSDKFNRYFSYMCKKLSSLPIQNSAVELISDDSIKITLSFLDEKVLMLRKYMVDGDRENNFNDITYSFFINRKLISADVTNFETFTKNFKEYITN